MEKLRGRGSKFRGMVGEVERDGWLSGEEWVDKFKVEEGYGA